MSVLTISHPLITFTQAARDFAGPVANVVRPLFGLATFTALMMLLKPFVFGIKRAALFAIASIASTAQRTASGLANFFNNMLQSREDLELARREAYFAEAVDIFDLENRMREFDRKNQYKPSWM